MWRRLARASIWHPDAIPPEELKYASIKRVWLPLYDFIAVLAGIWALAFGSPILHKLFSNDAVDFLGALLAAAGLICFFGVLFPALWRVEIACKLVILMLLGGYAATIVVFRTNPEPEALFIVFILCLGMIPPLIRLSILGEEIKDRHDEGDA